MNCCLLHLRKPSHKKEINLQTLPEGVQENYDPVVEERLRKMYDCIRRLDETGKLIILMVLEGVDYAEIASVVGLTEETLRVRIHRIKKLLAKCVKL